MNIDISHLDDCDTLEWEELDVSMLPKERNFNYTGTYKNAWHAHHEGLTRLAGEGYTMAQAAKQLNVSRQRVAQLAKRYQIDFKQRTRRLPSTDCALQMISLYALQGLTPVEVAKVVNMSQARVEEVAKTNGIKFRDQPNVLREMLG